MATLAAHQGLAAEGRRVRLTKNDRLVLNALEEAGGPLKAYDLLERLKGQGIGAPMTVYRALDRLQKQGLVHKLDGLGAFMVCKHGYPHDLEVFLICTKCDAVEEVFEPDEGIRELVKRGADTHGYTVDHIRVEVRGICPACNPK